MFELTNKKILLGLVVVSVGYYLYTKHQESEEIDHYTPATDPRGRKIQNLGMYSP